MELEVISQSSARKTNPLSKSTSTPIDPEERITIIESLWGTERYSSNRPTDFTWDAYFTFYNTRCGASSLPSHLTHGDIISTARLLRSGQSRSKVRETLRKSKNFKPHFFDSVLDRLTGLSKFVKATTGAPIEELIDLSRTLLSMDSLAKGWTDSTRWESGNLKEFLSWRFDDYIVPSAYRIKFGDFLARNLEPPAGIKIEWTDNLADHLRLIDGDRKVCVFHHVTFLKWLKISKETTIYPPHLIQETLDTLALLFPSNDPKTQKYLRSLLKSSSSTTDTRPDSELLKCGHLQADRLRPDTFRFFQNRVRELNQVFHDAELQER